MENLQLDLFQSLGEHETSIFQQAKLAKSVIQKLYNSIELHLPKANELLISKYAVLRLDIILDLVSDISIENEPSTPKVFIWQFTPSFILLLNNEEIPLNDFLGLLVEPKVIKSWINTLYTSGTFTQSEFHAIASQYFTLEVLFNVLSNHVFVNYIESILNGRNLIFYFENKLFPSSSVGIGGFLESDMIKKANNYFKRLCMLHRDNWYFVGSYESFTDKVTLLKELDRNMKVIQMRAESNQSEQEFKLLSEIFQNDFLFLNNYAFFEKKHNTHGWDENYIVSPEILDSEFNFMDDKKLFKANGDESIPQRQYYIYFKKLLDSNFIRTDILIPNSDFKCEKLKEIISLTHELKK